MTDLLENGGGKEESYLTDRVTHVISEDEDHPEVTEARDLFELPVVSVRIPFFIKLASPILPLREQYL